MTTNAATGNEDSVRMIFLFQWMLNLYFPFQLLSKPKYSGVEKIKTIGSTYMAASGLRPGRHRKKVNTTCASQIMSLDLGKTVVSPLRQQCRYHSFVISHRNDNGMMRQYVIWYENVLHDMHYTDVIMITMASQITSFTVVYSIVYSDADQRKYQSSASLAFVRGIHR